MRIASRGHDAADARRRRVLGTRGAGDRRRPARGAGTAPPARAGSDLETVAPPRGLPVERERDPGRGPTPHEPVFLEPAATTTEHARLGLSALDRARRRRSTTMRIRAGSRVGFTITWPPPARDVPSSGPSPWRGSAAR